MRVGRITWQPVPPLPADASTPAIKRLAEAELRRIAREKGKK